MLSSSRNLEVLDLTHNKIQSVNKEAFTNTTNLRYLSVSHNLLTELPAGLVNLTNLEASVNILGVLSRKDIEAMSSLLRLNLSSYEISRLEVASFNETPRLTHLDLSRNRLRIIEQSTLAALVSLTELSLAENQLEDINGLLTTQTHLSFLNLSSNLIQWLDYAFIPNSLQILDLQNNRNEEVESYFSLKDGFNLEYLDLSRNRIRNSGVLSLLPSPAEIILRQKRLRRIRVELNIRE